MLIGDTVEYDLDPNIWTGISDENYTNRKGLISDIPNEKEICFRVISQLENVENGFYNNGIYRFSVINLRTTRLVLIEKNYKNGLIRQHIKNRN